MKTLAAILIETNHPLELVELEIPRLTSGQVLVKISATGICHTQILEYRGYRGEDKYLPHCLGHEGSGTVLEVGPDVKKVKSGDNVILSWIQGSGKNVPGTVYNWGKNKVNSGAITTFSHYSVISENRLTRISKDIAMLDAALIGCAIPTGAGSVINTGNAVAGQSIAVFGAGGIGSVSINAAHSIGCYPVIAIDINNDKLETAKTLGATCVINSKSTETLREINRICPGGVDLAIEATGLPDVMTAALASVRNQGGIAVVVGNAHAGEFIRIDPRQFNNGKQLRGTWGGDTIPDRDFPKYMDMILNHDLTPELILSDFYQLEDINNAIADLESGKVLRPMIKMVDQLL